MAASAVLSRHGLLGLQRMVLGQPVGVGRIDNQFDLWNVLSGGSQNPSSTNCDLGHRAGFWIRTTIFIMDQHPRQHDRQPIIKLS